MLTDPDELLGRARTPIPEGRADRPWDIVFLDRDGTLNEHRPGYISRVEDLVILPGAVDAVRRLNDSGARVVLVTNQRGLSTGRLSQTQLTDVHTALVGHLADGGAHLDAIQVCPHEDGTCGCRKPLPGLFEKALDRAAWAVPTRCSMIGDQPSDITPAERLGMSTQRVGGGRQDVAEAVDRVLKITI